MRANSTWIISALCFGALTNPSAAADDRTCEALNRDMNQSQDEYSTCMCKEFPTEMHRLMCRAALDGTIGPKKKREDYLAQLEEKNARRKQYVNLQNKGGIILTVDRDKPSVGCSSSYGYEAYMRFYLYGEGSTPSSFNCWRVEPGTSVELKQCDSDFSFCEFSSGFFSRNFWTSIDAVGAK